ncbi:MAG: hypothetical protein V1897_20370 [Pseudomonadota bacterium]
MSGTFDDTYRQVIPRWLDYEMSCYLGLLRTKGKLVYPSGFPTRYSQAALDWQSNPTIITAADLVAEKLIFKDFEAKQSRDAAIFILDNAPESARLVRDLAEHFLNEPTFSEEIIKTNYSREYARACIATLKRSVRSHPLNPVAWSDLSLCYAMLGHIEKAQRSMQVALVLGKQNRFILRSATRCFFHAGDPKRAVDYLRQSNMCNSDPWIAAAEIAISDGTQLRSTCIKAGWSLVENMNISPFAKSELAAALCTMEAKSGSQRKVKKLVKQALVDPSENALAQVEWLASQKYTKPPPETKTPASYEAESRHYYREKQFDQSLIATEQWARFQLFSSQPLIQAMFISSVCLNNDPQSISMVESASPTHRKNPLVINNLAFALARQGKIKAATEELKNVDRGNLKKREMLAILATQGLICFRSGETDKGRELYNRAVLGFDHICDNRSAAIAAFFWAFEEKRAHCREASACIANAKKRVKKFEVFEIEDAANAL